MFKALVSHHGLFWYLGVIISFALSTFAEFDMWWRSRDTSPTTDIKLRISATQLLFGAVWNYAQRSWIIDDSHLHTGIIKKLKLIFFPPMMSSVPPGFLHMAAHLFPLHSIQDTTTAMAHWEPIDYTTAAKKHEIVGWLHLIESPILTMHRPCIETFHLQGIFQGSQFKLFKFFKNRLLSWKGITRAMQPVFQHMFVWCRK